MRIATALGICFFASAAFAQNDMGAQLNQLLGSKDGKNKLGEGIAIASLLGCTGKTAGSEPTQAFYKQMQAVGKQVETLCKAKRAPEARALVLNTLETNQSHPVVGAAVHCYTTQKEALDSMAGPKLADDMEYYSRWAADPALARAEMTDHDICQ